MKYNRTFEELEKNAIKWWPKELEATVAEARVILSFPRSSSYASPADLENTVIPAWMPESSHKDVKLRAGNSPDSNTCANGKLPSMALDSGIHAGMTGLLHLCITASAERGLP